MKSYSNTSLKMILLLTLLTGILYPIVMTGIAMLVFPYKSNGSIIERNGKAIGSELAGQKFEQQKYFQGRPSAIDYQPLPSGGSNLGPTSNQLKRFVDKRREAFIELNGLPPGAQVPQEMLFASASGIDPHITPDAARLQITRISKARGWNSEQRQHLEGLINRLIEEPQFGILGEARINVLKLNLAVDSLWSTGKEE